MEVRKVSVCRSCEQLTRASFWCFWHTEKRPGPRVLTRGLAGVEPLWAEHHTVRGGERGVVEVAGEAGGGGV